MEEAKEMIQEEREEFMVSHFGKPVKRIAHFLTPTSTTTNTIQNVSTNPNNNNHPSSKSDLEPQNLQQQVTVVYNGWRKPASKWKIWVHHLTPKFQSLWKEAGIYEAIMCSTLNIKKDYDLLLSLAQKWNPTTNTFVFPWGEATLTLEDVLILGGYSVTGLHFFPPFFHNADLEQIENSLKAARRLSREAGGRQIDAWLNALMKSGSEFEHEAFLSFWLANFLFPTSNGVIQDCVFPIAVRLAKGIRFSIAPAVLACVYRDLRLLKHTLVLRSESNSKRKLQLSLYSPFQLVQMWAWERFETVSPIPNTIRSADPRAARWNDVKYVNVSDIRLALDCATDIFRWRPYAIVFDNWQIPRFYKEKEEWVIVEKDMHEEIICLVLCLRVSELVGIGKKCIELYLPHRVAMQFGFDQDVPMQVDRCHHITAEIAWSNYSRALSCSKIYIPSRFFEADVSVKYMEWWPFTGKNADELAAFSIGKKSIIEDRPGSSYKNSDFIVNDLPLGVGPTVMEMSNLHGTSDFIPSIPTKEEQSYSNMKFPPGFGPNSTEVTANQLPKENEQTNMSIEEPRTWSRRNLLAYRAKRMSDYAAKMQSHLNGDEDKEANSTLILDKFPTSMNTSAPPDKFKTLCNTQASGLRNDPTNQTHDLSVPVHGGNVSLLEKIQKMPDESDTNVTKIGGLMKYSNDIEAGNSASVIEDHGELSQSFDINNSVGNGLSTHSPTSAAENVGNSQVNNYSTSQAHSSPANQFFEENEETTMSLEKPRSWTKSKLLAYRVKCINDYTTKAQSHSTGNEDKETNAIPVLDKFQTSMNTLVPRDKFKTLCNIQVSDSRNDPTSQTGDVSVRVHDENISLLEKIQETPDESNTHGHGAEIEGMIKSSNEGAARNSEEINNKIHGGENGGISKVNDSSTSQAHLSQVRILPQETNNKIHGAENARNLKDSEARSSGLAVDMQSSQTEIPDFVLEDRIAKLERTFARLMKLYPQ
ncbi:hypothetical protein ACFE04_022606 [Oxalis oulophora]